MEKTTVMAEFIIRGDKFDPQIITNSLDIEPTSCWTKETDEKPEFRKTPPSPYMTRIKDPDLKEIFRKLNEKKIRPKPRPHHFSLWKIDTGYEESDDIDDQIIKIYDILKSKVSLLRELKSIHNLLYTLGIVVNIENNEKPGMYFDKYIIDFVYAIEATIDIDLYVYS